VTPLIAGPVAVTGLGEVMMVGVPCAIANAVFNATGKCITDLPITIERCCHLGPLDMAAVPAPTTRWCHIKPSKHQRCRDELVTGGPASFKTKLG
jgi:hypothetical protein